MLNRLPHDEKPRENTHVISVVKCHVTSDRTSLASSYFYTTRISQDDLTAEAWTACGATVFFFFSFPLHGAER